MGRVEEEARTPLVDEVENLKRQVAELLQRVGALEASGVHLSPIAEEGEPELAAKGGSHTGSALGNLATACFALVGALLLRTSAHQGWLEAWLGIALGLGYCATLLVAPALFERRRGAWAPARTLQICGLLLVPMIVLESVHRDATLSLFGATAILAATTIACALAAHLQRAYLLALLLPVELAAVAALGLGTEAASWRGGVALESAALALWLAHRHRWPSLRPSTLFPALALLCAGVLLTARRPHLAAIAVPFLFQLVGLAVLAAASAAARLEELGKFETASVPITAALAYLLSAFASPGGAPTWGASIGAALLVFAFLAPRERPWGPRAASLSLTSGALLIAGGLSVIDSTGLLFACAALVVQHVGRRHALKVGRFAAPLLVVCGVTLALLRGKWSPSPAAAPWPWVGVALLSSALYALLYVMTTRPETREQTDAPRVWCRCPALLGALIMAFCGLQLFAATLNADVAFLTLTRTILLALGALVLLLVGKRRGLPAPVYLGATALGLLILKVLFWDIVKLDGGYLVGSVLVLGISAALSALTLRRPRDEEDASGSPQQ